SATSKPPPMGVPNNAATTGLPMASIASMTSGVVGFCGGWPNSEMSAPAMKVRPAQVNTTPAIAALRRTSSNAATTSLRSALLRALTGGLLATMTPMSPSIVTVTNDTRGSLAKALGILERGAIGSTPAGGAVDTRAQRFMLSAAGQWDGRETGKRRCVGDTDR